MPPKAAAKAAAKKAEPEPPKEEPKAAPPPKREAPKLDEGVLEDFKDWYTLFDEVGDGKIYGRQIGDVLRSFGENPTVSLCEQFIKEIGDDKRIDFDTFLPYLGEAMKFRDPFDNYEAFQECLKCYDKDGIGVIDSAAFRHGLSYLGEKLKDEEIEELMGGLEDGDGRINIEEFCTFLLKEGKDTAEEPKEEKK
ncbi:neo-calmodulin-like [Branchiostoma floridae]|uniref:Neo-calmodulin-like n=1 Tax=Branchiostoma floridae TaxID=7739 RepID=A0A9J7N7V4_BRAFL|nr:neo-calmodulin-like [Branchiostoma floridae]